MVLIKFKKHYKFRTIYFIKTLNSWICSQKQFGFKKLLYILDNCPSHKSNATIKIFTKLNLKIKFLPAYSPNLAPIELWFGFLKQKLTRLSRSKNIKLDSVESDSKLFTALRCLTKELNKAYFSKLYDEIKICINYYK